MIIQMMYVFVMSFCSAQISGRMAASTGSIETSIGDLDARTVSTWNIQISRGPNNVAILWFGAGKVSCMVHFIPDVWIFRPGSILCGEVDFSCNFLCELVVL